MSLFCENGEYRDDRSDKWERYLILCFGIVCMSLCVWLAECPMTFAECVRCVKYVAQNGVAPLAHSSPW
uniref:Uncharacterized protein n=1 Tax=Anguilla anguilla TaxID=7936 RepID=A0A0E9UFW8_ANGAN